MKRNRIIELMTLFHGCIPRRYRIAIKVVDIFGKDTKKVIEVGV